MKQPTQCQPPSSSSLLPPPPPPPPPSSSLLSNSPDAIYQWKPNTNLPIRIMSMREPAIWKINTRLPRTMNVLLIGVAKNLSTLLFVARRKRMPSKTRARIELWPRWNQSSCLFPKHWAVTVLCPHPLARLIVFCCSPIDFLKLFNILFVDILV